MLVSTIAAEPVFKYDNATMLVSTIAAEPVFKVAVILVCMIAGMTGFMTAGMPSL
jgi:hypothetical protein